MPYWLRKQLRRAFIGKDSRQIRLLNDCWFLFQERYERRNFQ
ncbi:MAG: cortex morphogenetic protein CmpA [Bacillaceae bacterium]|nr:cortex morphogenetic protein CmpA [Bacillaceae bacterium]